MLNLQQVKTDVDLVQLIGQTVLLKQQGTRWVGRCPFHDDHHPSLAVSAVYQNWRCWVCNIGGDAIDWIRLTENCSLPQAVQRLANAKAPKPTRQRPKFLAAEPLADRETRNRAFTALVTAGTLLPAHREALIQRGLSEAEIDQAQYISLPRGDRQSLVAAMGAAVPALHGVPGVSYAPRTQRWRLEGAPGLLIPVRDRYGKIQACQIRLDDGPTRYQWLTSAPHREGWTGVSPGTPFHVAGLRFWNKTTTWWVTEGPLKADVTAAWLHRPVLGIPGIGVWSRVGRVLARWHPPRVILALDQDPSPSTRSRVDAVQQALAQLLQQAGIGVFVAHWPEGPKGIDDAVRLGTHLSIQPYAVIERRVEPSS